MKKLLIHSNNTSFNKAEYFTVPEQFVFDVDLDKDTDFYIDESLMTGELGKKIGLVDIVFIKVALSKNYLEYLGIRLAYHIRLTKSLGAKSNVPIVFIAEEEFQFLGVSCDIASILFTKSIYLINENIDKLSSIIRSYHTGQIKGLEDYEKFINSINLNPPANYRSRHAIANEWSILRWANVIGIPANSDLIRAVHKNIESLLYYKYLSRLYPLEEELNISECKIQGKGKILYIDDEWDKGWDIVLRRIISENGITFKTLENSFKDESQESIIDACEKSVISFDPDIVLLDLRLSDSDFISSVKPKDLTGYKVLEVIKSINPGIQVIIFTASNKIWNFSELLNAGSCGFVLKESPGLNLDANYASSAIKKLSSLASSSLEFSFLKKVYLKSKDIKNIPYDKSTKEIEDFVLRLTTNLEVAFSLLSKSNLAAKYINYAYLQLFQIIEDFCKLTVVFKDDVDFYVIVNGREICVQKILKDKLEQAIDLTSNGKYEIKFKSIAIPKYNKRDTNFKVSALLIFRLGNPNSSVLKWTEIYTMRNAKAAHFNIENSMSSTDIFTILDFILYILNPESQNEVNSAKGLKEKTLEEGMAILKQKFKKR